ncbi:hypothetical protein [Caballeronia sp. LZ001]|uniref:hypothetical protein n=1 Tax=Caballeronia sp. LZ001 TaxID=3038553 RepID=UPI00285CF82E|nr:hypothetical protein [Caballeronia sp. LZ001]MDR5801845.1 hypothetical protein [Caballeronia sp. LZ001]
MESTTLSIANAPKENQAQKRLIKVTGDRFETRSASLNMQMQYMLANILSNTKKTFAEESTNGLHENVIRNVLLAAS